MVLLGLGIMYRDNSLAPFLWDRVDSMIFCIEVPVVDVGGYNADAPRGYENIVIGKTKSRRLQIEVSEAFCV